LRVVRFETALFPGKEDKLWMKMFNGYQTVETYKKNGCHLHKMILAVPFFGNSYKLENKLNANIGDNLSKNSSNDVIPYNKVTF
jgi:hypothetical protein